MLIDTNVCARGGALCLCARELCVCVCVGCMVVCRWGDYVPGLHCAVNRHRYSFWMAVINSIVLSLPPQEDEGSECRERGRERDWGKQGTCLMWEYRCRAIRWGAALDENGEIRGGGGKRADEEAKTDQTVRQADGCFDGGLIKDINEQCLTTNERREAVLTDRWMESSTHKCTHRQTHSIVRIYKPNTDRGEKRKRKRKRRGEERKRERERERKGEEDN